MSRNRQVPQLLLLVVVTLLFKGSVASVEDGSPNRKNARALLTPILAGYSPCSPPRQCSRTIDCSNVPEKTCSTVLCYYGQCIYKPYAAGTLGCDDGNACTIGDYCNGQAGPGSCKPGKPKDCSIYPPPKPALKSCYGPPVCHPDNGTCIWTFNDAALQASASAASACGTWAGAFATSLASTGATPNPVNSAAWSECLATCQASICAANEVPACSCMTTAYSRSVAVAGTCVNCPVALMTLDPMACEGIQCDGGNYYTGGTQVKATCWYPDKNVKSGAGGILYPCPGTAVTNYVLTGGTSISMCAGCVSIGAAYDKNSTRCYGGNVTVAPVDP